MTLMLAETVRELRWLRYSRSAHFLGASIALFAVWSVFSGLQYFNSMSDQFNETLENYRAQGRDIDAALQQDAGVIERLNGARDIANPLRYDFDNLMTARSNFTLLGSVNHMLGTSCLLLLPILFFAIGAFWASHDLESGGISVRITREFPYRIAAAKIVAMVLSSAVSVIGCAVMAVLFTLPVALAGHTDVSFFSIPPVVGGLGSVVLAMLTGILIAVVAAVLGAVVELLLRQRILVIIGVALLYFLTPLFGGLDPRNILASAVLDRVHVYGFFTPMTIGDISSPLSTLAIFAVGVLASLLLVVRWKFMAKRVN